MKLGFTIMRLWPNVPTMWFIFSFFSFRVGYLLFIVTRPCFGVYAARSWSGELLKVKKLWKEVSGRGGWRKSHIHYI